MKKLIFILWFGSILTAQPQANKHLLSQYQITNRQDIHNNIHDQRMIRSTNIYDDPTTGRPTKDVEQIWVNNEWTNNTMAVREYAPAKAISGKFPPIVSILWYIWASGAWIPNGHENWSYDIDGNLIEILSYDLNGDPFYRATYTGPFINGLAAVILYQMWINGAWVNDWRYTYTYDTNGCTLDKVQEMWNGSAWTYIYRWYYYYNNQECCLEKWVESYWDNGWVICFMRWFDYGWDWTNVCMTDKLPFAYAFGFLNYLCNPGFVNIGPTTDGINMQSMSMKEEYTYIDCLAMTYVMYNYLVGAGFQMQQTNYTYSEPTGKVSSTYDNSNKRLTSQVTQIDGDNSTRTWYSYEGLELSAESESGVPKNFSLKQNYPNPFNPSTTITFDLSEDADVKISIYDMAGRLIRELVNKTMTGGSNTVIWDAKDDLGNLVSGGVYLYNLEIGDYSQTKKMVLIR